MPRAYSTIFFSLLTMIIGCLVGYYAPHKTDFSHILSFGAIDFNRQSFDSKVISVKGYWHRSEHRSAIYQSYHRAALDGGAITENSTLDLSESQLFMDVTGNDGYILSKNSPPIFAQFTGIFYADPRSETGTTSKIMGNRIGRIKLSDIKLIPIPK